LGCPDWPDVSIYSSRLAYPEWIRERLVYRGATQVGFIIAYALATSGLGQENSIAETPDLPVLNGGVRYTMAESARLKGVSYHTVSRAVRSGKLPAQRLGRMALITAPDLQAWRPMRERAPRKYRRDEPNGVSANERLPVSIDDQAGYIDRLVIAGEQLLAVASAESTAGFGNWLARWLAISLQAEMVVIWQIDGPDERGKLYGAFGLGEAPPRPLGGAGARVLRSLSEREAVVQLDRRTAGLINSSGWLGTMESGWPVLVPLRSGSHDIGCAIVVRKGKRALLSPDDAAFYQRIGLHAAFAMEHVAMREGNCMSLAANESLLDELPIQLVAVDANGTFVYGNRAFVEVWGEDYYSRYVGRHYSHLQRSYRSETLDGVEVRLEDHPLTVALRGGRVDKVMYLVPEAPGTTRVFQVSTAPTLNDRGQQTGAIMAIRETTEDLAAPGSGDRSPIEMLTGARRRVEMLANLSNEIAERQSSDDIFELLASRACDVLEATSSLVTTPAPNNQMTVRAAHNVADGLIGCQLNRFSFPTAILAMANRDIHYLNEDEAFPSGLEMMRDGGARVALLVPLIKGDESLGVMALHYRDVETLRRVDPELARAVGRQCGHAVHVHNVVVELEASRRRLLTTLDQLPQAVLIADEPEGHIVAMNQEAQSIWGDRAEWLGKHMSDIVVLDDQGQPFPPDRHPFLRPLTTLQTELGVPLTTRDANDRLVDVVANVAPVIGQNGNLRGAVAVLQRREHFKPIDQAKDEFISVVAHELRNPLTSLRGNLQLLERRLKRMDAPDVEREMHRVAAVIEQVDRIGDLVGRMLDVSRADLGKLTISPSPTDAVQLVEGVITDLRAHLGDQRINLHAPDAISVEWDRVRVQQILVNLITNAIRYAPEGDIDVTVDRHGDNVSISVRDRGRGVPMRLRRRLFRLYYRFDDGEETIDGLAMQQRGLGIGLYISARLATAHGGDLSVADAEGGGAVFILTLPEIAPPGS
jgi:excisionase family DNA binding protein